MVILDDLLLAVFLQICSAFFCSEAVLRFQRLKSIKVTALYFYHCVLMHAWQLLAAAGTFMFFCLLWDFQVIRTISVFSLT